MSVGAMELSGNHEKTPTVIFPLSDVFTYPFPIPMSQATLKRENLLVNLACNLVVPTIILMKFSTEKWLGPVWGLIVALIFPIGYGLYDLAARKKTNFLSILGVISVLLSGGMGLMKADGFWFAVKDAVLPTCIGAMVLGTLRTKSPLLRQMFYNEQIVDVARVDAALAAHGKAEAFEKLMRRSSVWLPSQAR